MNRSPLNLQTSTACVVGALALGCSQQQPAAREDLRDVWRGSGSIGAVEHPGSVAVARGFSPLVYQVRQAGVLHVTDATSGAELASAVVQPGTIVWVDEDKGVFAGKQKLRPGPLADGHAYLMSMDVNNADEWKAGVQVPRPAPPPPTQPGQVPGH